MKYYASKISENLQETPEGYLLCLGVSIARTGEQIYADGETPLESKDGRVTVSRSEKEVFSPETIASFEGKPFTIKHPSDLVSPENWGELAVGHIQNVRRGDGDQKDDLVADIMITDQRAISLVRDGLRGLSCGYEAEYVQTGDGTGEQIDIVGNHLALVEEGRAGPSYSIKDHTGVFKMSKTLADKIKSMLGKTIDEAMEEKKEDKKDEPKKAMDADMYDEMVKMCDSMKKMYDAMMEKAGKDAEPVEIEAKDEEPDMKAMVKAHDDLLKQHAAYLDELMGKEESEDEIPHEEGTEGMDLGKAAQADEDLEVTGDEKARVEILAPGMKITKDFKVKALTTAYTTKDGKAVIDGLSAGKPNFEDAMLFRAASELLKSTRRATLASTKSIAVDAKTAFAGGMTSDEMNKINEKIYGQRG